MDKPDNNSDGSFSGNQGNKGRLTLLRADYRSFSHDVTVAILVYKTMNRRSCLCTKKILWELNSFHMLKLSFIPSNLQSCWPRDWKLIVTDCDDSNLENTCTSVPKIQSQTTTWSTKYQGKKRVIDTRVSKASQIHPDDTTAIARKRRRTFFSASNEEENQQFLQFLLKGTC